MLAWKLKSQRSLNAVVSLLETIASGPDVATCVDHGACRTRRDLKLVAALADHSSESVRSGGACAALRKRNSEKIAAFLNDSSERVVLESVRAVHDVPAFARFTRSTGRVDLDSFPERGDSSTRC